MVGFVEVEVVKRRSGHGIDGNPNLLTILINKQNNG